MCSRSIKLGQALSIRPDLVPAAYVSGLTKLQDSVKPFSSSLGRAAIESELGVKLDEAFSQISMEPVASASIGQVYRGTIRATGEEVAVKVQRPNVLSEISLDLFMLRTLAPTVQRLTKANTDFVGLVDAWGAGFVDELDYTKEARATDEFAAAMEARGLGSVTSPKVIGDFSSTHVLTTGWVDGERLAASGADDVPRLCAVALNAYLTMLLDTGVLHCDPHPGNLLRTPEGQLVILDFGMTLEVPRDLQLALLEFIADLNAENYERVPTDLVQLGFVPADKVDELRSSGLTVAIARMLKLAAAGGGPAGAMRRLVAENKEKYAADLAQFDDLDSKEAVKERQRLFKEGWQKEMAEDALGRSGDGPASMASGGGTTADLTRKIEELQQQNSNVFAIPDYFVYMSRAFSTLEGIGLSADPDYAILGECFPYLARRLISDDSPRARGALKTLLYGTGDELDLSKLTQVARGAETFSVSTSSVASSTGASDEGRNAAIAQLVDVALAEEGNFVQSLLIDEAAVALDAAARRSLIDSAAALPKLPSLPMPPAPFAPLLAPLVAPLVVPLAPLVAPVLPLVALRAAAELSELDARDAKRLHNLDVLADLLNGSNGEGGGTDGGAGSGDASARLSTLRSRATQLRSLAGEAAARRVALSRTGVRFGGSLVATQTERLRRLRKEDAGELSAPAARLADAVVTGLEGASGALERIDKNLAQRTSTEAGAAAAIAPAKE